VYNGLMAERPDFWTAQQLAKAAGVDDSYVRRLCIDGKLDASKLGNRWVISDKVARDWLALRAKQQELDL